MPRTGHVEVVIRFRGREYDKWKEALEADEADRVRHGGVGHWIARSVTDPHEFIGVVEFTSLGGAKDYMMGADRAPVQQAAMIEGGPHDRTWDEAIYETIDTATYPQ